MFFFEVLNYQHKQWKQSELPRQTLESVRTQNWYLNYVHIVNPRWISDLDRFCKSQRGLCFSGTTDCSDPSRAHSFPITCQCSVPEVHPEGAVPAASPAHTGDPAQHTTADPVRHGSSHLCNLTSNQARTKILLCIGQAKPTRIPKTKYFISTRENNWITGTILEIFLSRQSDTKLFNSFSNFIGMKKEEEVFYF